MKSPLTFLLVSGLNFVGSVNRVQSIPNSRKDTGADTGFQSGGC